MPETPQSSLSGASTSPPSGTSLGSNTPTLARPSYGSGQRGSSGDKQIQFPRLEVVADLSCDGASVTPDIEAKIDTKNVFWQDNQWTCYRRNYISVACHYTLTYCNPGSRLYAKTESNRQPQQVQALGLCLSATADGPNGKPIGLVKHTPKRDRGPQTDVQVEKLPPAPPSSNSIHSYQTSMSSGPSLPLQHDERQPATGMPQGQYTFERIQFKQATANNGRRRATQQFYHLCVELHADIRASPKDKPKWVKIAQRISEAMVVRGRSPGHYKDTPRDGSGHSGSSGGGSSGGGFSGFGGVSSGSSGARGYATGLGFGFATPGSNMHVYGSHHRSFDQHYTSSSSSLSSVSSAGGNQLEHRHGHHADTLMTDDEAYDFQHADGYRYYPHTSYDTVMHPATSHGPTRPGLKLEEFCSNALPAPSSSSLISSSAAEDVKYDKRGQNPMWYSNGAPYSRFQGVDSSRGHFATPGAGY